MPYSSTAGKILVDRLLPDDLRDRDRLLDKKGLNELLRQVAEKHPDRYRVVAQGLSDLGREVSTRTGGNSFGVSHLAKTPSAQRIRGEIEARIEKIEDDERLNDEQRNQLIVRTVGAYQQPLMDAVYKDAKDANNPLAEQILSGARGNKMNLASLLGMDLLYTDHRDNIIPLPVLRSYGEGLTSEEAWAGAYGARRGVLATKMAVRDAGYFGKQLNQVNHRLLVTSLDREHDDGVVRGMPVDTNDPDNEGALLAQDIGPYKKNTVLSQKIMQDLVRKKRDRILVRSPIVSGSPDGGVYGRDVGVREGGLIPGRGSAVGNTAAQALSEPLTQGGLSAKHSGGVAGQEKSLGGFEAINQILQVPDAFKGGAAHSEEDGFVDRIEDAPAGGQNVTVNGKKHYVSKGFKLAVAKGDRVEAGDVLSEGLPNPSTVVKHKGIGEGRRYFTHAMREAFDHAGIRTDRRNLELLARGLINHVRLTEETDDHVPDDVVPYSTIEHSYKPRKDATTTAPKSALGQYLESPVLHYTIGTKIRPSVQKELEHFGVDKITTHREPPPFQPEMIRGMASLQHDPDVITRMYGSGLKSSLLEAVHHGGGSDSRGTSFVPGLARAVDFGREGLVRPPEPGSKPADPNITTPLKGPSLVSPEKKEKPTSRWSSIFKSGSFEDAKAVRRRLRGNVIAQLRKMAADAPAVQPPLSTGSHPPTAAVTPPGTHPGAAGGTGSQTPSTPPTPAPYDESHDFVHGTASQNLPPHMQHIPGQHASYGAYESGSFRPMPRDQLGLHAQDYSMANHALASLTGQRPGFHPGGGAMPSAGGYNPFGQLGGQQEQQGPPPQNPMTWGGEQGGMPNDSAVRTTPLQPGRRTAMGQLGGWFDSLPGQLTTGLAIPAAQTLGMITKYTPYLNRLPRVQAFGNFTGRLSPIMNVISNATEAFGAAGDFAEHGTAGLTQRADANTRNLAETVHNLNPYANGGGWQGWGQAGLSAMMLPWQHWNLVQNASIIGRGLQNNLGAHDVRDETRNALQDGTGYAPMSPNFHMLGGTGGRRDTQQAYNQFSMSPNNPNAVDLRTEANRNAWGSEADQEREFGEGSNDLARLGHGLARGAHAVWNWLPGQVLEYNRAGGASQATAAAQQQQIQQHAQQQRANFSTMAPAISRLEAWSRDQRHRESFGRMNSEWTDPVSGQTITSGQYNDYYANQRRQAAEQARQEQNPYGGVPAW